VNSPSAGSKLKTSITEASRKIESIIDDAERAAAEIRADARVEAEREAQRALTESSVQLASVVDPLAERVETLRVEAAALVHEIEAASKKLVELTQRSEESSTSGPNTSSTDGNSGPAPVAYPGASSGTAASPASDAPEEAVLRATQMAVAGSSRSEIEETLRSEFGLADAGSVVDDILGPA
jgi:hypothetical protein